MIPIHLLIQYYIYQFQLIQCLPPPPPQHHNHHHNHHYHHHQFYLKFSFYMQIDLNYSVCLKKIKPPPCLINQKSSDPPSINCQFVHYPTPLPFCRAPLEINNDRSLIPLEHINSESRKWRNGKKKPAWQSLPRIRSENLKTHSMHSISILDEYD